MASPTPTSRMLRLFPPTAFVALIAGPGHGPGTGQDGPDRFRHLRGDGESGRGHRGGLGGGLEEDGGALLPGQGLLAHRAGRQQGGEVLGASCLLRAAHPGDPRIRGLGRLPVIGDHLARDRGQFVGGNTLLPGPGQEQGGTRQADRNRGVLVAQEVEVPLQAVTRQARRQAEGLAQQGGEIRGPVLARPVVTVLDHGENPPRVEQDVHQPAAAVQASPHPVVRTPGTLVEGREMVQLHPAQLGNPVLLRRQQRPGVGADLDELHRLVDHRLGGLQGPLGEREVEQPVVIVPGSLADPRYSR